MTVERPNVEIQKITNGRVNYSEIISGVVGHDKLTPDQRIDIRAVDLMVDALKDDGDFEQTLLEKRNLTIGNVDRLSKPSDPNYRHDLLWSVHNPEELFVGVLINGPIQHDENGDLITDGRRHVQEWGRRLLKVADSETADGNLEEVLAKKRVKGLILKESEHLEMDYALPGEIGTAVAS